MKTELAPGMLGKREKIMYGLGDYFVGGSQVMIAFFYLKFLTDVVGINPLWAGTVVLITKIWDAIIDPVLGVISDNARTRWGRRRPFIFAGGLLVAIGVILVWYPVNFGNELLNAVFVTVAYLFYCTASSIAGIPYTSLLSEISDDYRQRNSVNSIKQFISQIGILINATVPLLIINGLKGKIGIQSSYIVMACVFAVLFAVPLILAAVFSKERVEMPKEKSKFEFKQFVAPYTVKYFRNLIVVYLLAYVTMDIVSAIFQYYMDYILLRPGQTTFVIGAMVVTQLLMAPVVYKLTKRFSKAQIFRISVPIWVFASILLALCSTSWPAFSIFAIAVICGIGVSGCIMIPWYIFVDAADIGEIALGCRTTGSFSGAMTFSRQISSAFGIFLLGAALNAFGYIKPVDGVLQAQPASLQLGLRIVIVVTTVLLLGICILYSRKLNIDEATADRIKVLLGKLRCEGAPLTEQETQELDVLKKKYI